MSEDKSLLNLVLRKEDSTPISAPRKKWIPKPPVKVLNSIEESVEIRPWLRWMMSEA